MTPCDPGEHQGDQGDNQTHQPRKAEQQMCILSHIPAGIQIDSSIESDLWNGGINNPDGHGWAIASNNGQMILGKSLDLHEAIDGFVKARAMHDGPALFHSRWATHGSVRVGNCHPFLVGNSHQTVLAHNGVLPKKAHPLPHEDRSDTAILAEDLMPRQWKRLDKPSVRKSLSEWCGKGNKLVILTVEPKYRENVYIINENSGHWDGYSGLWHSNYDYKYDWRKGSYSTTGVIGGCSVKAEPAELVDPTSCVFCNQRVNDYQICTTCGTCQDCLEVSDECLCWNGSESLHQLSEAIDPNLPIPYSPVDY